MVVHADTSQSEGDDSLTTVPSLSRSLSVALEEDSSVSVETRGLKRSHTETLLENGKLSLFFFRDYDNIILLMRCIMQWHDNIITT